MLTQFAKDEAKHEGFMRGFDRTKELHPFTAENLGLGPKSAKIRQQGEWTYIQYGVEEIKVKKDGTIVRVGLDPPDSPEDFDFIVEIAKKLGGKWVK